MTIKEAMKQAIEKANRGNVRPLGYLVDVLRERGWGYLDIQRVLAEEGLDPNDFEQAMYEVDNLEAGRYA